MANGTGLIGNIKYPPNLLSLPQVILRLMNACRNEDTTAKELSQIISKDPWISAKVMRLVNSAYIGLNSKATSVESAVIYLGTETIKNIAISASVLEAFRKTKGGSVFNLNRFWWHSLMCAALARRIAQKTHYLAPEEAFLTGLLHDIGKLVIWASCRQDYAPVLEQSRTISELLVAESAAFGVTHCEVGAQLIDNWGLNTFMADAIRYHHEEVDRIVDAFSLLKIIYVANALCQDHPDDPSTGAGAANVIFSFSSPQIEATMAGATDEVTSAANTFDIEVEPPPEPTIVESEKQWGKRRELINEVKNSSLLLGTLECLVRADNRDSIIRVVEKGLQILFDTRKSITFLYYPENKILAGAAVKGGPREGLINSLEIPIQSINNLLVRSLKSGGILDSFSLDRPLTIADEQIIRLLGAEGIVCLPMIAHKNMVGVIVMSADPQDARQLKGQAKLLRMLAGHAAMSFHLHEVKRNQAKKIELERQEASSAMARVVIHEVNNPLGIVKNYIKIIERKLADDSQAQDELRIINEEIDRVGQIIRQLTSFSSPDRGKYEDFDLNSLIADVLKILHKSILRPANLKAHLKQDAYLPMIKCNKNSLIQILINLIKNAAEAMPQEGNIYIETKHVDFYGNKLGEEEMNSPSWVQIVIRDDGPGIPEKIKDHMFEPANTTKDEGHYGLGLSIVYNIVRDLKGLIDWKSEKEAGTVFKIQLPMTLRNNGKGPGGTDA